MVLAGQGGLGLLTPRTPRGSGPLTGTPGRKSIQAGETAPAIRVGAVGRYESADRGLIDPENSFALSQKLETRLEVTRRFPPQAESVSTARRFVVSALIGWGEEPTDVVALLTSELVTNVVIHAGPHLPGQEIVVSVTRTHDGVRVHVTDSHPGIPVLRNGGVDQLSGRGLMLLDALAAAWGVVPNDTGKLVWFEVKA